MPALIYLDGRGRGCRVRLCAHHGMKIVAQGGNTGMCGAARPRDADRNVVSRLDRMRKIRAVSPLANTITLEAGGILQEVQEATNSEERSFCAMGRPATSFSE